MTDRNLINEARRWQAALARIALLLAAGLCIGGGLTPAANAQDKTIQLRLSHWVPTTHPMHATALAWGKSIEEASGGTLKVQVFPAQQLGRAPDHYDMTMKGIVDIAYISTGYQAGRMIVTSAAQLPFMITDPAGGSRAFDEWYRPYAAKDMPGVKLCAMFVHDPGSLHSKTKITHPDQIKGLKMRPANATIGEWMKLLGGTTVNVTAPEAREALERGVADAITFPWDSLYLFGIDKTTKFHIDAPLYVSSFAWIINQAKYDSMSAAQKKVMDDHCNGDWAFRIGKEWGDQEAAGRTKIKADPSHTVSALSPAELDAWKKSAQPLVESWSGEMQKQGYDPAKILEELKATLAKYQSKS
jgi:TRAP-type transport system periplasmic protein